MELWEIKQIIQMKQQPTDAMRLTVRLLNAAQFRVSDILVCLRRYSGEEVTVSMDQGYRIARVATQVGMARLREAAGVKSVRIGGILLKLQFPARATGEIVEDPALSAVSAAISTQRGAPSHQNASQSGKKRKRLPSPPSEEPPRKYRKTLHQTDQGGGPSQTIRPIADELDDEASLRTARVGFETKKPKTGNSNCRAVQYFGVCSCRTRFSCSPT
ncbi:hypothetical protein BDR26DRAFT_70207 [Obelidium mucronatum]|nr:hypothetical protein BDR26DRAFT_70207 [Obelidium mucronatum]